MAIVLVVVVPWTKETEASDRKWEICPYGSTGSTVCDSDDSVVEKTVLLFVVRGEPWGVVRIFDLHLRRMVFGVVFDFPPECGDVDGALFWGRHTEVQIC